MKSIIADSVIIMTIFEYIKLKLTTCKYNEQNLCEVIGRRAYIIKDRMLVCGIIKPNRVLTDDNHGCFITDTGIEQESDCYYVSKS